MKLTITAYSAALFSTWVFIEELGVLFDAGDGVSAMLFQKSRKTKHIFISHADRDHVTGLLRLHELNAHDREPTIYFPRDCGSFPALRDFAERFDPQSGPATWKPLVNGDIVAIDKSHSVRAFESDHIIGGSGQCKALCYVINRESRTLKEQYKQLPGQEIAAIREAKGEAAITDEKSRALVGYSGDTSELHAQLWQDVEILIHECTFLESDTARRSHSNLQQVLQAAATLPLKQLVLIHFSTRYGTDEIRDAVRSTAKSLRIRFPIHAVVPGELSIDTLAQVPVWNP